MRPRGREFVFGMEPIEQVLYGEKSQAPTTANAYLRSEPGVEEICSFCGTGNLRDMLSAASSLGESGYLLSIRQCSRLAIVLRAAVPDFPNPVLAFDLETLGPLLRRMWDTAINCEDEGLQDLIASVYFRWFEHGKRYEEARRILTRIIEICRNQDDHKGEARAVNNLAFEYMLEKRWKEAVPLLEAAAESFRKHGHVVEMANSLANCWLCRLENGDVIDLEEAEREVLKLKDALGQRDNGWQARKPFILLARIEEARGNRTEAIRLAERAVKCGEGGETHYAEQDLQYLEHLRKVWGSENGGR